MGNKRGNGIESDSLVEKSLLGVREENINVGLVFG
jgi:hypothetical protein